MRQIFGSGLGSLAFLQEGQSRAVNCENPTGEKGGGGHEELYQTPFMGYHFYSDRDETFGWRFEGACPPMRGLYRFHIMDAVRFEKDLKVTIQQIGMGPEGLFERQDDYASVAYWYQSEPHGKFPDLAPAQYRRPR